MDELVGDDDFKYDTVLLDCVVEKNQRSEVNIESTGDILPIAMIINDISKEDYAPSHGNSYSPNTSYYSSKKCRDVCYISFASKVEEDHKNCSVDFERSDADKTSYCSNISDDNITDHKSFGESEIYNYHLQLSDAEFVNSFEENSMFHAGLYPVTEKQNFSEEAPQDSSTQTESQTVSKEDADVLTLGEQLENNISEKPALNHLIESASDSSVSDDEFENDELYIDNELIYENRDLETAEIEGKDNILATIIEEENDSIFDNCSSGSDSEFGKCSSLDVWEDTELEEAFGIYNLNAFYSYGSTPPVSDTGIAISC